MGITRIADVTGLDQIGIPVCMAVRPNSRSLSVSQGKGVTLELAKASAAMESIESYHAENIDLPVIRTSYQELANQKQLVVDPARLLTDDPTIFHPNLDLFWVQGTELLQGQEIWMPHDAVGVDFTNPTEGGFSKNSNGLASGNHLMEALSHAICEVVERDATVLNRLGFNPSARPLNLNSVDSIACQEIFSTLHQAGLQLFVWNTTHDIGIPTFECSLFDPSPPSQFSQAKTSTGYGTHLSKEIALLRAVTEAVQSRLTLIAGSRDDLHRSDYLLGKFKSFQDILGGNMEQDLLPAQDYAEIPSLETDSLDKDVHLQLELLRANGFDQVIMVDLTKPEFNIPVVHVLVPGMEFQEAENVRNHNGERAVNAKVQQIMQQLEELMQ